MNGRRVALVTGAAGFIGSHLVKHLLTEGWTVRGLDDLSAGRRRNLQAIEKVPTFELIEGSTLDAPLLAEAVAGATHLFHLAGKLGPTYVEQNPAITVFETVQSTQNVLDAVRPESLPLFLASTSEIYGDSSRQPLSEDDDIIIAPPANPRSSYALAKGIAELLVNTYIREQGGNAVIGRLFNTIGPRQSGAYGHVVPTFIRLALAGEPIVIHGSGEQTRSFTAVADASKAIVAVLDSPAANGETINIGSRYEMAITELAHLVVRTTGSSSPIQYKPYATAHGGSARDIRRRVPDVTKLRELAGFECSIPVEVSIRAILDSIAAGSVRLAG